MDKAYIRESKFEKNLIARIEKYKSDVGLLNVNKDVHYYNTSHKLFLANTRKIFIILHLNLNQKTRSCV